MSARRLLLWVGCLVTLPAFGNPGAVSAAAPMSVAHPAEPLAALPYSPSLDVDSMDPTTDACVDFYQYACGGWMKRNPIPDDQPGWSVYAKLTQDNQRFLWGILEGLATATSARTPNQQKIGDFYAACMDEAAVDALGARPLGPALGRIRSLSSPHGLPALLAGLQLENDDHGFFFGFGSDQDFADAASIIAFAEAGGLALPDRDYYTDTDARATTLRHEYLLHLGRVFASLGDAPGLARRHAATVLDMETRLAKASLTRVARRDPHHLFHRTSRAELARLTPHFDWDAYFAALGVAPPAVLNVTEPAFFAAFDRLVATTPVADLRTYLRWHAAHAAAPYLGEDFYAERFAFFEHTLRGTPKPRPRWRRCVTMVDYQLTDALSQEFVARTFGPAIKESTLRMTRQIEQAMREDIEGLPWMSAATKTEALAKLAAIANKIGYPDHWRDYSAVEVRRDDLYGNVLRAKTFESRRELAKIGRPLDRGEWFIPATMVNAYYSAQMNDINFPAGVLQPPLYDVKLDDAPNYGNTGGTIGHELTHGFDDEGRQFDGAGNLRDWWTPADEQEFNARTQCIVDQYSGYTIVDDIHINGRLTVGEDAADLGGLILAHMAWRAETLGKTLADRDGLTPEQRFYVGYAQWACENERPENLRVSAKTNPHSPGRYRVNGLMVNLPDFQAAFRCKTGQPMVKADRCRVW
jgi:endothelin-converting enzyme/putative endopeptidase